MFKHNLLITLRNFKSSKSSIIINLIGLSTGLACAFLIFLWVNDELHVDKFHIKDNQLYQVMTNHHLTNGIMTMESTPDLLAETLTEKAPEIGNAISLPLAYLIMNKMLQVFVYRISLGADVFLLSILISIVIVILSISGQSIRAAMANPVELLRYE